MNWSKSTWINLEFKIQMQDLWLVKDSFFSKYQYICYHMTRASLTSAHLIFFILYAILFILLLGPQLQNTMPSLAWSWSLHMQIILVPMSLWGNLQHPVISPIITVPYQSIAFYQSPRNSNRKWSELKSSTFEGCCAFTHQDESPLNQQP